MLKAAFLLTGKHLYLMLGILYSNSPRWGTPPCLLPTTGCCLTSGFCYNKESETRSSADNRNELLIVLQVGKPQSMWQDPLSLLHTCYLLAGPWHGRTHRFHRILLREKSSHLQGHSCRKEAVYFLPPLDWGSGFSIGVWRRHQS